MKDAEKKAKKPKHPRPKRTCVACGRPMAVRPDGCPWHRRCGVQGGME